MNADQIGIVSILVAAMALFVYGRWRHDVVAFTALMVAVIAELVPAAGAFAGFGHPAVFTVAAVLVLSRALQESGAIDEIARRLEPLAERPALQLGALTGIAAVLSGVMNNVGALALLMPVALATARKSERPVSEVLMPLSFASILGGLTTLIGTPPNIIIAAFRREYGGASFSMFDFLPIGLVLAAAGVAYVNLLGWRLIPGGRSGGAAGELFQIEDYVTEARVPKGSAMIGRSIHELESLSKREFRVLGLIRDEHAHFVALRWEQLREGDVLILQADSGAIDDLVGEAGLELGAVEFDAAHLRSEDMTVVEVVIPPGARIEGRTAGRLQLMSRFGLQLLAIARQGQPIGRRLHRVVLRAGDVLLLQGHRDGLADTIAQLGCLPLAERGARVRGRRGVALPVGAFAIALLLTGIGVLPVQVAFGAAIAALVLGGALSMRRIYDAIDWPVIVLLAAMIPIGGALQTTGTTELLADAVVRGSGLPVWLMLAVILVVTMTLSDFMNNAATAVVMAPIAAGIAHNFELSVDPFLMAVAIGASCAFLTPIGHQNNVLVMGPGGYRFGDYWRMGLPLEALITAIAVPMLLWVWPP